MVLFDILNLKAQIRSTLRPLADPLATAWFRRSLSYSASGEDRFVLSWLEVRYGIDVRKVRYCDIGANHPTDLSNTFLFYHFGARGVLVEPDPNLCTSLRSKRSRDTVLNVGVAFDERRSANLHRLTSSVFNTFLPHQAQNAVDHSKEWKPYQRQAIVDQIKIPLVPANDILSEHFPDGLDFLSIDAEGVDLPILQSINFDRFRPKMICIEASADFDPILRPAGYEFVAKTPDNLIFRLV
jgi:FkbM family methyltransferase